MASNNDGNKKGFSITWILENFPYFCHKKGEKIVSPAFIVNSVENSKWRLWIFPRGEEDENSISYYLHREEDSKGPISMKINLELLILHPNGSTIVHKTGVDFSFTKNGGFGCRDVCKRDNVIAPEGTLENNLTIRCRMWKTGEKILKDEMCLARTRFGVEQRSFIWEIDQFSALPSFKRNVFQIKSASNDELIMTLTLTLIKNATSLDAVCISCYPLDHYVKLVTLKVVVLDANGGTLECGQGKLWFNNTSSLASAKELKLSQLKQRMMLQRSLYLPNDVLTLQCECTFSNKTISAEIEKMRYGFQIRDAISEDEKSYTTNTTVLNTISAVKGDQKKFHTKKTVSDDLITGLYTLFKERTFCDVKINTKTESFPAHWLVLSARSPVFRAMYNSDMKEKTKECINVTDIDADTVQRMLLYVYTDSLEDVHWENATQLYEAADKYDILSLKNKCSNLLKDNLCQDNACEVLVLADMHNDTGLKKHVQDFILKHDKVVMRSPEWELLMNVNAKLAAETMFLKYKEK